MVKRYSEDDLHNGLDRIAEQCDRIVMHRAPFGEDGIPCYASYRKHWSVDQIREELEERGVAVSRASWYQPFAETLRDQLQPGSYKLRDFNAILQQEHPTMITRSEAPDFIAYVQDNVDDIEITRSARNTYRVAFPKGDPFQQCYDTLPDRFHPIIDAAATQGRSPDGVGAAIDYLRGNGSQDTVAARWDVSTSTVQRNRNWIEAHDAYASIFDRPQQALWEQFQNGELDRDEYTKKLLALRDRK